jgi:hypothetical protein
VADLLGLLCLHYKRKKKDQPQHTQHFGLALRYTLQLQLHNSLAADAPSYYAFVIAVHGVRPFTDLEYCFVAAFADCASSTSSGPDKYTSSVQLVFHSSKDSCTATLCMLTQTFATRATPQHA